MQWTQRSDMWVAEPAPRRHRMQARLHHGPPSDDTLYEVINQRMPEIN